MAARLHIGAPVKKLCDQAGLDWNRVVHISISRDYITYEVVGRKIDDEPTFFTLPWDRKDME